MQPLLKTLLPLLASAGLTIAAAPPPAAPGDTSDPVILAFAVTGDTRMDPTRTGAPKPNQVAPASAFSPELLQKFNKQASDKTPFFFNVVQVQQTLQDLGGMKHPPKYLFVTGDLVMGFAKDDKKDGSTGVLEEQLNDFQKAVQLAKPSPTKLVILPGNHEMTFKAYDPATKTSASAEDDADNQAWDHWVQANGYGPEALKGDRITLYPGPGKDALVGLGGQKHLLRFDQSHLTYSFDDGPVHFVVMNTDTDTTDGGASADGDRATEGLLPFQWVKDDIGKAQANAAIQHIFVFGHRPIQFPKDPSIDSKYKPAPEDTLNAEVAEPLRQVLVSNSKVRALLVSHVHLFHADSLAGSDAVTRPVQIIAGNGGMSPESFWNPAGGAFFGFTVLKVHQSGKVTYNSWQRPAPMPYFGASSAPAKATANMEIK